MRSLISLALILSSSTLLAAPSKTPSCPKGTQSVLRCVSTPQPGDGEFASGLFQGISVCQSDSKYFMAFKDVNGKTNSGEVSAEVRAGGSTYSANEDGVNFKFSVVTGTFQPTTTAKFYIEVEATKTTEVSTYTCK